MNDKPKPIHNAFLTVDDVILMRKMYASGKYTQAVLAKKFEVSVRQVWRIINRKRWAHVEDESE